MKAVVPVFLDQFIATVKLRTWFIISFCHLQYLNQIISFRYALEHLFVDEQRIDSWIKRTVGRFISLRHVEGKVDR